MDNRKFLIIINRAHNTLKTQKNMNKLKLEKFTEVSDRARAKIYDLVLSHYKKYPNSPWSGKYLVELENAIKSFYEKLEEDYDLAFRDTLPDIMKDFYDRAVSEINKSGKYKAIVGAPDANRINYFLDSTYEQVAMKTRKMRFDHIKSLRNISADVLREASLTGATYKEVSQAMLDRAMKIKDFEFIDRSGQKWPSKSYFNTLARTELMNAARSSYDDKMADEGFDVMKLSTSGECCEKCARFEGKLFSLTGATPGLPTKQDLIDAGVFHPNCTHSYSLVPDYIVEEYRKQEKSSDSYFSGTKVVDLNQYRKDWDNELKHISEKESDGIGGVTGIGGTAINSLLRGTGSKGWDEDILRQWALDASSMFDHVKNINDVIVYRCVEYPSFLPAKGKTYIEKGFSSCSVAPLVNFGNTVIEIRVPRGCRGAYVESLSSCSYEHEFLLDKNTKFVILDKKTIKINGYNYDCVVAEVKND